MTTTKGMVGRPSAASNVDRELALCRYETWRSKRNGREVAVIDYNEDLGWVEYVYFGGAVVFKTKSATRTKRFTFVRCP